jgi:hypothetical protein
VCMDWPDVALGLPDWQIKRWIAPSDLLVNSVTPIVTRSCYSRLTLDLQRQDGNNTDMLESVEPTNKEMDDLNGPRPADGDPAGRKTYCQMLPVAAE